MLEFHKALIKAAEELAIVEISPGLYQIGKDGPIVGKTGLEEFDKVLKEKVKKYVG